MMIKLVRVFVCASLLILSMACDREKMTAKANATILLADPTIFLYEGTYYLYGTSGDSEQHKEKGFLVYTSGDLKSWEGPSGVNDGLALKKGDAFGDKGFWAPQVFEYNNRFYMAYTANEHIAIAVGDSPLGPFTNPSREALNAPVRQIDPFVFMDDDGRKYLYHVRLDQGNRIFVAELNNDLMSIREETLKECLSAELPWENMQQAEWPVSEGPTVLKHKGLYYMLYSANDFRSPDYAVGFATSESPLGPWKKSEKAPIINKALLRQNGTGHGDVFTDEEGVLHYVFHTHLNDSIALPRRTALVRMEFVKGGDALDHIEIDPESFRFLRPVSH
jgi:beta-xylosidase